MPSLPESDHTTARAIVKWYEAKPQSHREHLGASLIGHECDRYLWQVFRWVALPQFEGRMLRLFNTGVREEARVFEELRGISVELHTHENGRQIQCRDESGHFGGSVDGIGKGFPEAPKTWAILEIKTHGNKSYLELIKMGVEEAKPRHYAQMQIYMRLLKIDRALYFAVNKDTDAIYTQWIHHDEKASSVLLERASSIIDAAVPPAKLSEDPAYFGCKFCEFSDNCHQQKVAQVNCRTCCHATVASNGTWKCALDSARLMSKGQQDRGCEHHLFIPALVPFATATDAGDGWVEYTTPEGRVFKNGQGFFASTELHHCVGEVINEPIVHQLKETFPGAKIERVTKRVRKKNLSALEDKFFDDSIPF